MGLSVLCEVVLEPPAPKLCEVVLESYDPRGL